MVYVSCGRGSFGGVGIVVEDMYLGGDCVRSEQAVRQFQSRVFLYVRWYEVVAPGRS